MQLTRKQIEETMSLADAAQRLSLSWAQTWRLVLTGRLEGIRLPTGRWAVTRDSIARFKSERGV